MKVYKGVSASPGLVLGQVSRLEHHVETFSHGPFNPERELRLLANAVHTAQNELDSMAERAAPTEQAIFLFQSMMLDDEGMMNEVRFCINAGISASAAMHQVGQRYADQLANMKDNPYMQLRSVDILDATRRVINILTNRPRVWLALDHPVILAADRELASAEHYYRPASPAMKKLITMVMDAASAHHVPVTICGLAVGNPANTAQYLHLGLRSFSVSPQNLLKVKQALLDTDAHPDAGERD